MVTSKKDAEEVQCGRIWGLIGFDLFGVAAYSGSAFLNWQTSRKQPQKPWSSRGLPSIWNPAILGVFNLIFRGWT